MKEFEFLKGFEISISENSTSIDTRAAFEIAGVNYSCFNSDFGFLGSLEPQSLRFPDLLFSSQSEIEALGVYHPIWNCVISNDRDPQIWAIRIGSRLRRFQNSIEGLLSYVRSHREVFLRQWSESHGQPKTNSLVGDTSVRKREISKRTSLSVDDILTGLAKGDTLSFRGALKLAQRGNVADMGLIAGAKHKDKAQKGISSNQPQQTIYRLSLLRPVAKNQRFQSKRFAGASFSSRAQLMQNLLTQVDDFAASTRGIVLIDASLPSLMTLSHVEELISLISREKQLKVYVNGIGFIELLAERANTDIVTCLKYLVRAGIEGVFDDDTSRSTASWLYATEHIHRLNLYSSTGANKSLRQSWDPFIVKLYRTRCLHQKTKGFSHFTPMIENGDHLGSEKNSTEYLKMISLSRLFLPSSISIHASSARVGRELASIALSYGADSMGYREYETSPLLLKKHAVNY
jgi:cyclic dehypoxanthinyl futalosine synthase